MRVTRTGEEISLSGPPRNVTGAFPIDESGGGGRVVPISVNVGDQSTIYRAVVRPVGKELSEIRLRLPDDTPPGVYTGEGTIGGKQVRIAVEVEPVVRIRVQPQQTVVRVAASSSVEFGFILTNHGNVPFEVPKSDVLDLDDNVGQDRALGRTLRAPLSQGEHRVDRFFEELRESHGGEARVAVRSGAGPLGPGESRELTCLLDVPVTAKEGRSYVGPWQLGNAAHVIIANIMASGRPTNGKENG